MYYYIHFMFTLQKGKLRPREVQKVTLGHTVRCWQGGIWHQSLSSLCYLVLAHEWHFYGTVASGCSCGGGGVRRCLKRRFGARLWNTLNARPRSLMSSSVLGDIGIDATLHPQSTEWIPQQRYKLIYWDQTKILKFLHFVLRWRN